MVTLTSIQQAQSLLHKFAVRTPLVLCKLPDGRQIFVKPENLQPIGSFKLRGAYNKISSLSPEQRSRGVVAHSSGNHAQMVAIFTTSAGLRDGKLSDRVFVNVNLSPKGTQDESFIIAPKRSPVYEHREEFHERLKAKTRWFWRLAVCFK